MSEFSGSARSRKEVNARSMVPNWARQIAVRVCAAIVIGLVSPHLPVGGQHDGPVGGQHDGPVGVCIVDTRT